CGFWRKCETNEAIVKGIGPAGRQYANCSRQHERKNRKIAMIGSNTQTNGGKERSWRENSDALSDISTTLNSTLADMFTLYFKTKNFHWHVSGPHFRDYHLLFDEQAADIFGTTDEIAERVRKIGGTTLRSIAQVSKLQSLDDNDESFVPARDMLRELMNDNKAV